MKNKITIMLVMVMMLSLVSSAQAGYFWFSGVSGDWANSATWAGGVVPTDSDAGGIAIVNGGGTIGVTTAGQGSMNLWLGYESGVDTVNVAAGKYFHVTQQILMGYGGPVVNPATGILNIAEGASVLCEQLQVGVSAGYHGTINIANGGLLTSGMWGTMVGPSGTGSINMEGNGKMIAWTLPTIGMGSYINLGKAGQLEVMGDYQTQLQEYINNNKIIAFGRCVPVLSYDFDSNITFVVGSNNCSCVSISQGDLNKDCYVDMMDLAMMAANWLDCTDASNADCR